MDPWKRRFLLRTIISRFHVNFLGCTCALSLKSSARIGAPEHLDFLTFGCCETFSSVRAHWYQRHPKPEFRCVLIGLSPLPVTVANGGLVRDPLLKM